MSLVKILLGYTAKKAPETISAGAFMGGRLRYNFHLGCAREEGKGSLGALLGPPCADVGLTAIIFTSRMSVQRALAAMQPEK